MVGMKTKEEDFVEDILVTNTHDSLLCFTTKGKVYSMMGYEIPEASKQAKGREMVNILQLDDGEKVNAIIPVTENETGFMLMATKNGLIKKTNLSEFENIRKTGKIAIKLLDDDQLISVQFTNGQDEVVVATHNGKCIRFSVNDVRPMGRTASGVRGMNIDGGTAVGMVTSLEGEYILAITDRGYGKMTHYTDYRMTSRGTKGVITIHATEKVGNLVTIRAVYGNEDLMVITQAGVIIRIPLEQVKIAGRNTQGVKIIRLDDDQRVSSVAVVEHQEQEEIVEEEK